MSGTPSNTPAHADSPTNTPDNAIQRRLADAQRRIAPLLFRQFARPMVTGEPPRLSVNEQLAQARRNAPRVLRRPPGSIVPLGSVGLQYINAVEQRRVDDIASERDNLLKQVLAGPLPPSSWKNDLAPQQGQREQDAQDQDTDSQQLPTLQARRHILGAWRAIKKSPDPWNRIDIPPPRSPLTLVDYSLAALAEAVVDDHGEHQDENMQDILLALPFLPEHLRSRLLSCIGHEANSHGVLCDTMMSALFAADADDDAQRMDALVIADTTDKDWDEEDEDGDDLVISTRLGPKAKHSSEPYLDLSFARIDRKTFHDVISLNSVIFSLRSLSLAGCCFTRFSNPSGQASNTPLVISVESMRDHPLSSLTSLESLCLAGCRFLTTGDNSSQLSFWHQFWGWRHRRSLRVLDLSYASGLDMHSFTANYRGYLSVLVLRGVMSSDSRARYPEGRLIKLDLPDDTDAATDDRPRDTEISSTTDRHKIAAYEHVTASFKTMVKSVRLRQWCDVYI